jgi:hypothetical protein
MTGESQQERRPIGQNMKRLIIEKMSVDAVPAGGGLGAALAFITEPGELTKGWREATAWVDQAIAVIRTAAEPNPWRDASEEEIAAHLLEKIAARKKAR